MITRVKFLSLGFLFAGIFVLMQVILPILSFQIWEIGQRYNNQNLNSPTNSRSGVLGVTISSKDNFPAFISAQRRGSPPPYDQFLITLPSVGLSDLAVNVDSNDLAKGLAQLPGTALPGERGNLFISGHSALSTLWTKGAYFSKLPDLKIGDQMRVSALGNEFLYQVINIKAVDPTDVSVIIPPDETGRYISLMTCVPPGLNFKRLVVLGKML